MCNAMEMEISVAGDVDTSMSVQTDLKENGGKDIVALPHRSSQPLKGRDFFVPVSQREKAPKKLVAEVAQPNLAAVDDGAKKKRGRPRKHSLEDNTREFFVPLSAKEKPKQLSSIDNTAALNSVTVSVAEDGAGEEPILIKQRHQKTSPINALVTPSSAALTVAQDGLQKGSDVFVSMSKSETLDKEFLNGETTKLVKTTLTGVEDGAKKRGRPRKSSLELEGNTSKASPFREADDSSKPKRGRPRKILLDDLQSKAVPVILQKPGGLIKELTGEEGKLEEMARRTGSTEDAAISPEQLPQRDQGSAGVAAEKNVTKPEPCIDTELVKTCLMNDRDNQVQETGKEGKQAARGFESGDPQLSQGSSCDDFFLPVSKRRKHKEDLQDKKLDDKRNIPSKPRIRKDGQAEKLAIERLPAATRPHPLFAKDKKSLSKGLPHKENASALPDSDVLDSEHDLRLEAVIAAHENARLNAGKATHPFFARKKVHSLKTSLRWEEASALEVEDLQPGPPMHVTQLSEDQTAEVVRSDWKLRFPLVSTDTKVQFCKLRQKRCGLVQRFLPMRAELDQRLDGHLIPTNVPELVISPTVNVEEAESDGNDTATSTLRDLQDFLQHMQTLKATAEPVEEQPQLPDVCERIRTNFSMETLNDKLAWYGARHNLLHCSDNLTMSQISKESEGEALPSTRNLLWTDLYQPRSSKEVCGNTAAVEALNTWLYNWQMKITGQPNKGEDANKDIKADRAAGYDSDEGWIERDSDVDSDCDVDHDNDLQTTLLVTGPEGCGKSAAVYACAVEQGFTVIEVNASDCRNGSLIKQKFGEATESHGLGKRSQLGVESPQAPSKRALDTQESSPGQSKRNGTKQKKFFAENRLVDRSPIKFQQERLMASEDENQVDTQSKRKTVILFEDVDKHFDEDKGFLTALVQLSKTTKRPIILTSNRCEPGLPPALEKCIVNFGHPTSEELVLHACLVSIAEGFPCSPWLLERFVDSCHGDLRKVMIALQFWGQSRAPLQQPAILNRPAGFVRIPHDIEHHQLTSDSTTSKLERSSKRSLSCQQGELLFKQWESDTRWLFELDVHHFILPKVISGSFVCPLTLFIGEKISAAVQELEEHMEQVAARESEERGRARQAEQEILELARKALKKEKDAIRRASQLYPKLVDDGVISLTPDEDVAIDNGCGESWARSPVKSLREAKTLARSPLKPKILKSRRSLLLCDSDDEEQRLHIQPKRRIQISNQDTSDVETQLPAGQFLVTNCQDRFADVVIENLEDTDVTPTSISEVMTTRRRKRLSKKHSPLETDLESSPASMMVGSNGKVPHFEVEPSDIDNGEFFIKRTFVGPDIPKILAEEGNRPLLGLDENDRLNTELKSSMPGVCKGSANPEMGSQQSVHNFDSSRENQIEAILLSGAGQLVDNTSIDITAVQQRDFIEGSNIIGDSDDIVLMSKSREQLCCSEVLQDAEGSHLESDDTGQAGIVGPLAKISGSAEKTVDHVSFDTDLDAQNAAEECSSSSFEPVNDAWTNLRKSQQTSELLQNPADKIADVTCLSDLLDIISDSDVISCVEPEEHKDAWRDFDKTFSEAFEGNIGHSRDWESCQEISSQLVCTGLQQSLPYLEPVNHSDYRLPVLSCILESAKDPPAVGKCMVTYGGLTRGSQQSSELYGMVDNLSGKMSPIRQADRQGRLEEIVQAAVFPKGRVSRSGFVEYSSYLSRMSQLEETRRTKGLIQGRRPRRFEHHLISKLKSLSSSDITELLKHSYYKS